MRIKEIPSDFAVEEQLNLPLGKNGQYAVFRVEKRSISTPQVQSELAAALDRRVSAVRFPALKDRQSTAVQYASVPGNPPPRIQGDRWTATYAGRLGRPLRPTDIAGNRFTLTVRDMSLQDANRLRRRLRQMAEHGLPNYFDRQRFGSYSPGSGFIAEHILARDAEGALRAYLTSPQLGDPEQVKRYKRIAANHWGDWDILFTAAPRPSNYRSVLTYLRDHPRDYRKALNLIPRRLLSLYLSAYQSFLWNRIAGEYLGKVLRHESFDPDELPHLEIAGAELPLYLTLPDSLWDRLTHQSIAMPHHRVVYSEPALLEAAESVLRAEGLSRDSLKARILKKAYFSRHQRSLLFQPNDLVLSQPMDDELYPGQQKLTVRFTLQRGCYATLLIRAAEIRADVGETLP